MNSNSAKLICPGGRVETRMGRNYSRQKNNIRDVVNCYNTEYRSIFSTSREKNRMKFARATMKLILNRKNNDKKKNH